MVKEEDVRPASPFSRKFGAALARVMKARGVTQVPLAEQIGRNQGYVSERLRGLRATDTDMIAGVAALTGVTPQQIVREIMAEMKAADLPTLAQKRAERTYGKPMDEAARESDE